MQGNFPIYDHGKWVESRERERETYEPSSHSGSTRLPPPLTPGSHDNLRPGLLDLMTLLVAIAVTRGQTLPTPKETDGEEDKRRPPPQLLAFVPFTKDELNTAAVRCCSDTDALLATAIADQPTSFQSCSCSCSFFLFVEKPRAVRRPLAFVKNARVLARKREQHSFSNDNNKDKSNDKSNGHCKMQLGASRSAHGQTLSILFFSTTAKCNGTRDSGGCSVAPASIFLTGSKILCLFPTSCQNRMYTASLLGGLIVGNAADWLPGSFISLPPIKRLLWWAPHPPQGSVTIGRLIFFVLL